MILFNGGRQTASLTQVAHFTAFTEDFLEGLSELWIEDGIDDRIKKTVNVS